MDSNSLAKRTILVTVFLVLAFSALSARIIYVQVIRHDDYTRIARAERIDRDVLTAMRGQIFDRNGEVLVQNQHVRNLIADRNHLTDIHVCRRAVGRAEGMSVQSVASRFDDAEVFARFVELADETLAEFLGDATQVSIATVVADPDRVRAVVCRGLEFGSAERLRVALRERKIGGLKFEDSTRRHYPNPGRAAQVLGYTDAGNIGREGVEGALEEHLAGIDGFRLTERSKRSSELLSDFAQEQPAINGADVELTIDMGLQNIVERVIEKGVALNSPEKITCVVMDPNTSEILAMASRPHFDQITREGVRKIHAISDRYEPGSTFKLITLAAAFDRGLVNADSVFFCHNGRYQEGRLIVKDHHPFAYLTTQQILAKSSNVGAYLVAKQVGKHEFHEYVRKFGFGVRTGIALTGEAAGMVVSPASRQWSGSTLAANSKGYEVDVTALQMLNAFSAIANGGTLMKPQIIHRVSSTDGEPLYQFAPKKIRRVLSESAANEVRKALMAVMEPGGTGAKIIVEGFMICGKTGTAKKPRKDRSQGYYDGRYVASFAGFLPAENPRLAIIVVVDDPQGSGSRYGGAVAGPLFAEIATEAMPYLGIKPTMVARRATRSLPRTVSVDEERF